MSSKPICRTCLRALRASRSPNPLPIHTRTISTILPLRQTAQPKQTQNPLKRDIYEQPASKQKSTRQSIAERIARSAPQTAKTYQSYGTTEHFFNVINEAVGYDIPQVKAKEEIPTLEGGEEIGVAVGDGAWYRELNMTPTFNAWAQLTMLHLYVLMTRIRCLPATGAKTWSQHLTDHFFTHAEIKMETLHSISSRSVRSKYLKDLFLQWRGVLISYDEGLMKGDAVLAGAVWRNLFGGKEDVDPVKLAMVVAFIRREVSRLGREDNMMHWVKFGTLKSEEPIVLMKSAWIDKPLPAAAPTTPKAKVEA